MTTGQRIILTITGIVALLGGIIVLFVNNSPLSGLIIFYLLLSIPAGLFYFSFSPKQSTTQEPPQQPKNLIENLEDTVKGAQEKVTKTLSIDDTDKQPKQSKTDNAVLFTARSVWPFQLFPDRLIIREKDLTFVRKEFFWSGSTETVLIKDIFNIRSHSGPIFGSLEFEKRLFEASFAMNNMWKSDALKAKQIIDGLMIAEEDDMTMPQNSSTKQKRQRAEDVGEIKEIKEELSS